MFETILTFVIGIIIIIIGISNTKGNISSLHSYHRNRVTEEDRIPFGKRVGAGMITIGCGIILFSICSLLTYFTENAVFTVVGTAIMIISIVVGLILAFAAMIKYNKGIF